jgi:hypothetical protein
MSYYSKFYLLLAFTIKKNLETTAKNNGRYSPLLTGWVSLVTHLDNCVLLGQNT